MKNGSLLPFSFAEVLLRAWKCEGQHSAVDCCACVENAALERVLPFTDMFLIDFKHADSGEHRRLAGKGNELVKKICNGCLNAAPGAKYGYRSCRDVMIPLKI